MGKKNPFVFTIGFDKSDPDHVYVTELLNTTEKKAKLIVAAILAYTGRTDETGNGSISMEPDMLRPMMQQIMAELNSCPEEQKQLALSTLRGLLDGFKNLS